MYGIVSGVMTTGLLAAAAIIAVGQADVNEPSASSGISEALTAQGRLVYRLQIAGGAGTCVVGRSAEDTAGRFDVTAGPKCPALYPPLAEVRLWHERNEGTVELLREDGTTVLDLAVSDGLAYETFRPGSPLISLVAMAD